MTRFSLALCSFFLCVAAFSEVKVSPLSEMREKLVLPAYTNAERQLLVDQATLLMRELFVHRELKVKEFGVGADPVPKLGLIEKDLGSLSADKFHVQMLDVFYGLHDLHTTYSGPKPVACGVAFIPIRFELVREGGWQVIAGKHSAYAGELTEKIALGDRLLEVDGRDAMEAVQSLTPYSGGSNDDAMKSRAVQLLSFRNLRAQQIPASNSMKLKLEGDGGIYEKEIPWMTLTDEECFGENALYQKQDFFGQTKIGMDETQHRFNFVYDTPTERSSRAADPDEALSEIFDAVTIETPAGTIGYIRIKTFLWRDRRLDLATIVDGMQRTVSEKLASAMGIVIDIRGNGGGHIVLAEKMIQLFSPSRVEPTTVRMLANSLNERIFLRANGGPNRWSEAIGKAIQSGAKYTAPMAITPVREANVFGQVWHRPVVVLTDANCYSACDLFAAGMQDNGAAVIVGTNGTTGGGGANVMEHATFRAVLGNTADNPFVELPHGQSMRVSWRQTVRAGKNQGAVIEGLGVKSDVVVPLKRGDIGFESRLLMKQIHRILDELAPKHVSGISVRKSGHVPLQNGAPAQWKESVWGIDSLAIETDARSVAEWQVDYSTDPQDIDVAIEGLTGEWRDHRVVLVGKREGQSVFRVVRELAWRGKYEEIPEGGMAITPKGTDLAPLRNVELKGGPAAAWREVGGSLRVGEGPLYPNDSLVRAFLPLQLNGKGGVLRMGISLEAEDINDSLRLYALNPDSGERRNYFAGSRLQGRRVSVPLPEGWERADVVFEFESDENWNLAGPDIRSLEVKRSSK